MNALKADPRSVDLRVLAPHFYRLGIRILQLFDEEEMVEILGDVCAASPFSLRHRQMLTGYDRHSRSGP